MFGALRRRWDVLLAFAVVAVMMAGFVVPLVLDSTSGPVDADRRNSAPFIQDNLWRGDDHDYAVLVARDGAPVAARRTIPDGEWETVDLSSIPGNPLAAPTEDDGHNVYAIAEGPDGRIHVIGNSHADELRYVRTVEPGDFGRWEAAEVAGPSERVTYPRFVRRTGGELLYFRRDGTSGHGDIVLDALGADGAWSQVGTVIDGRGSDENPYLNRVAYDPDLDRIHLMFTWRDLSVGGANRDIGHAMSDDGGRTWMSIDGAAMPSVIRHDDRSTVSAQEAAVGLVNAGGLVLDHDGLPHGALARGEGADRQIIVVHHDGERWHETTLDWPLGGRPAMVVDSSGTVWALGRRGSAVVAIDVEDASREVVIREARVPDRWAVAIDSRSMELDGVVRTLVPDGDVPRVVELFD